MLEPQEYICKYGIEQAREYYKQGNSHYFIDVSNFKEIDFYVIARLYGITDPNIQHVIKKLLAVGKRNGGKSAKQDIQECIDSLNRKLEIDKLLDIMHK